jgi:hypothetical protein
MFYKIDAWAGSEPFSTLGKTTWRLTLGRSGKKKQWSLTFHDLWFTSLSLHPLGYLTHLATPP